jgi:hypothetical protein
MGDDSFALRLSGTIPKITLAIGYQHILLFLELLTLPASQ